MTVLLSLCVALGVVNALLLILVLRSRPSDPAPALAPRFDSLERAHERLDRTVREEIARNREEMAVQTRGLREELTASLTALSERTLRQLEAMGSAQTHQLETMSAAQKQQLETMSAAQKEQLEAMAGGQKLQLAAVAEQTERLAATSEARLKGLHEGVEARLVALQTENSKKLDEMRGVVDEKLQTTLERRLGESFKIVSDRLEQVHQGLGEMQVLASGVGDLKKVLTNVKTRGTWGEIQLENLLEQLLTTAQYAKNVATKGEGGERVEFAIRLPGRGDDAREVVWLPIDAKFPQEDYIRLAEAVDAGDLEAAEAAGKQLELRVRGCARDICEKYIAPPKTTDFGIMYLPTEGLYAEVLRRTGLVESLQREHRVVVAGPTTLMALLNSLQMGFRTLAIQKRSSEVWSVLGAVKAEFEKFGGVLDKVKKKLTEASNVVEQASTRSRVLERKLGKVQSLPAQDPTLLPADPAVLTLAPGAALVAADGNGGGGGILELDAEIEDAEMLEAEP